MKNLEEIKTNYKEVKNEEKNGIELYFEAIPSYNERQILKENGYKWHNAKKCWYKKEGKITKVVEKIKKTAHSLKVGDILESSWGYEQTNNSFFRVEALKGATMVIIREVKLAVNHFEREGISPMSEDRSYNLNDWSYCENSVFIKDNERGEARKVKNYGSGDYVTIDSFANAHKYNGEKIYCSWYY